MLSVLHRLLGRLVWQLQQPQVDGVSLALPVSRLRPVQVRLLSGTMCISQLTFLRVSQYYTAMAARQEIDNVVKEWGRSSAPSTKMS